MDDDAMTRDFRRQMLAMGIVRYDEHETLWSAARHCARKMGVPMAGGLAVVGAGAGSVTLPVLGAVPGYVAGMLAGFAIGTGSCMAVNLRYKNDLKRLLED
jgi:hypothetical protein